MKKGGVPVEHFTAAYQKGFADAVRGGRPRPVGFKSARAAKDYRSGYYDGVESRFPHPARNPLTRGESVEIQKEIVRDRKRYARSGAAYYSGRVDAADDIVRKYRAAKKRNPAQDNPKRVKIYERILSIEASKAGMPHKCDAACKRAKHRYRHVFKFPSRIFGLPSGKILIEPVP